MKSRAIICCSLVLAILGGCGGREKLRESGPPPRPMGWRDIATPADRERIAGWRNAWTTALAKARASGASAKITADGVLLEPDAALPDPVPPPGDYACAVVKLGAQREGGLDYIRYPRFACRIAAEGDMLSFAKLDGSQRPVGLLFPNDDHRMVFLGTMALADEQHALDYGRDPQRDMVGAFERIGPARWRLALPWPAWESTLDVIELVPKG